jgi:hypothetical protein
VRAKADIPLPARYTLHRAQSGRLTERRIGSCRTERARFGPAPPRSLHSRFVCRARIVSDVSPKRGLSFRIASSKAIICAVSNSEPIGSLRLKAKDAPESDSLSTIQDQSG